MAEVVGADGELKAVGGARRRRLQPHAQRNAGVAHQHVERQAERLEVRGEAADAGEARQVALHRYQLAGC